MPCLMMLLLMSLHQHASDLLACSGLRKGCCLCLSMDCAHPALIRAVPDVQGMLQWHFPTAKTRRKQSAQLKPVKPATKVVREMLDAVLRDKDREQAS